MNRRDGFFTDAAAVDEMFGKGSRVAEKVMREYVRPRHSKNKKTNAKDNRNHFATASHPDRAGEAGISEAERMKKNLEALSWLPAEYVGKAVAAVYCEISENTFDVRLRAMHEEDATKDVRGKRRRPKGKDGKPIPGSNPRVSYRMSLVDEIKVFRPKTTKKEKVAVQPSGVRVTGWLSIGADGKASITLDDASNKRLMWFTSQTGAVFAHSAFNAQSPDAIARFLTSGGTIERMTIHEALTERTWINLDERAGWAKGYARLLTEERDAVAAKERESWKANEEEKLAGGAPAKKGGRF